MSGHTLKHLAAACAPLALAYSLRRRHALPGLAPAAAAAGDEGAGEGAALLRDVLEGEL